MPILGGEEIDVTNENKAEYVQLYVNYVLNSSCKTHFDAFKEGFLKVVNKQVLQLFSAKVKLVLKRIRMVAESIIQ